MKNEREYPLVAPLQGRIAEAMRLVDTFKSRVRAVDVVDAALKDAQQGGLLSCKCGVAFRDDLLATIRKRWRDHVGWAFGNSFVRATAIHPDGTRNLVRLKKYEPMGRTPGKKEWALAASLTGLQLMSAEGPVAWLDLLTERIARHSGQLTALAKDGIVYEIEGEEEAWRA